MKNLKDTKGITIKTDGTPQGTHIFTYNGLKIPLVFELEILLKPELETMVANIGRFIEDPSGDEKNLLFDEDDITGKAVPRIRRNTLKVKEIIWEKKN